MKPLWDQTSLWQSPITGRLSRYFTITRETVEKNPLYFKSYFIICVCVCNLFAFCVHSPFIVQNRYPNFVYRADNVYSPVAHPGTVSGISTRNYRFETKNHRNTNNSMALVLNKQKCRKGIQMLMFFAL